MEVVSLLLSLRIRPQNASLFIARAAQFCFRCKISILLRWFRITEEESERAKEIEAEPLWFNLPHEGKMLHTLNLHAGELSLIDIDISDKRSVQPFASHKFHFLKSIVRASFLEWEMTWRRFDHLPVNFFMSSSSSWKKNSPLRCALRWRAGDPAADVETEYLQTHEENWQLIRLRNSRLEINFQKWKSYEDRRNRSGDDTDDWSDSRTRLFREATTSKLAVAIWKFPTSIGMGLAGEKKKSEADWSAAVVKWLPQTI